MEEIKKRYRELCRKWHPDTSDEPKEICEEKLSRINESYRIVMQYLRTYRYSFDDKDMKKFSNTDEWWFDRFGDDPLWGPGDE